jgi:drug/metabolite transporter (DMT)-like permease
VWRDRTQFDDWSLLTGGLGIAAYNLLLNAGSCTVDAGTASFVVNTASVFAAILGAALLGERLRIWAGSALLAAAE